MSINIYVGSERLEKIQECKKIAKEKRMVLNISEVCQKAIDQEVFTFLSSQFDEGVCKP